MTYPVSIGEDGVKFNPEKMQKEKLYHCIFKNKALLIFKDSQDIVNCYEIEEEDLVNEIKKSKSDEELEKILESYIEHQNLKN